MTNEPTMSDVWSVVKLLVTELHKTRDDILLLKTSLKLQLAEDIADLREDLGLPRVNEVRERQRRTPTGPALRAVATAPDLEAGS